MPKDANKIANPRGMAIAKKNAERVFLNGGSIKDCPYKSQSWRSCFCKEMQRLQQQALI